MSNYNDQESKYYGNGNVIGNRIQLNQKSKQSIIMEKSEE